MAKRERNASIDPKLLELLACPLTKGPLTHDSAAGEFRSDSAKLVYPIRDGVAVMLPPEARSLDEGASGGQPDKA